MKYIDYNERKTLYKYNNVLYRKYKNICINYKNKEFLKTKIRDKYLVNDYELDKEQKKAIFTDEVNTLVVAGAGSGKTLTIMGKINYLIESGISEKEILCISFTNEACDNIRKKLKYDVEVLTFHKLALKIIGYGKYHIASATLLNYVVDEYFHSIIFNSSDMLAKLSNISSRKITFENYIKSKEYRCLKQTIITFINLFKANGCSLDHFCQIDVKEYHDLLSIIVDIYILYYQELKSQKAIDFDDMIIQATKEIKENKVKCSHRYIIIDEFQDTSLVKLKLIKTIQNMSNSKLFVVGDDFQSIYKFAGCDLDLFINFNRYFTGTSLIKITNTYRNSQQLVNCASKFILKNKYQIYKKIKSNKTRKKPIKIVNYKSDILSKIFDHLISIGEKNVLLLGRNNADINKYLNDDIVKDNEIMKYKNTNLNIRYLTVHRSKGLEEDCVIVINLFNDILGFPSQIREPKILSLINKADKYPYEEERRLFYVALTRTKKDIYLIAPLNQSIFLTELCIDSKRYIEYLDL